MMRAVAVAPHFFHLPQWSEAKLEIVAHVPIGRSQGEASSGRIRQQAQIDVHHTLPLPRRPHAASNPGAGSNIPGEPTVVYFWGRHQHETPGLLFCLSPFVLSVPLPVRMWAYVALHGVSNKRSSAYCVCIAGGTDNLSRLRFQALNLSALVNRHRQKLKRCRYAAGKARLFPT